MAMKQLIQNVSTGRSAVVEVPAPHVGHGELLVRVGASLISAGTEKMVVEFAEKNLVQKALARPDLVRQVLDKARREGILSTFEAVRTRLDSDMALGYSLAGTVIDVGPGVSRFQVGDRVACAGGGYASHAEIVRVPVNLVAKIPVPVIQGRPIIDFEEAAFTTVGAIALQGLRLARLQLGETVAVIGLGLIGLLTVELASAAGCHAVGMDVLENRCLLALKLGCAAAAQTTEGMLGQVLSQSNGVGADAVIICASTSSNGPLQLAGEVARERARVVAVGAVGLDIPRKIYYEKELSVYVSRSYGPGRYDPEYEEKGRDYPIGYVRWTENRNMQAFLGLLADGRLSVRPLITHRFPIAQAANAYELIGGGKGEPFVGVILTYPPAASLERRVELKGELVASHPPAGRVTVGMIGAGNFATAVLLPALKATQNVELEGLATLSGASARAAGSRFGFRYCTSDHQELLRDPAINTIVIATRHYLHSRQVIGALESGKHVFCEKPLCISREELAAVTQAYQHAHSTGPGPMLMVGFNRRFAPLAERLKEFVHSVSEPLVMTYRVNAGFLPPVHWTQDFEQGGGRIIGELCHFIDFLTGLIGKQVTSVHASALPNGGRYCDDNVIATLGFQDGSVGTITYVANGDKSFAKERLEVFGGGSVAVLDDFRSLLLVRGGRQRAFNSRLRQDKGHRGELESFSRAILAGGPAPIPFGELVNTTLASLEILKALGNGQPRIVDTQGFLADCASSDSE
jgi:predicted dehydrogenase/threonine dehydrogenase-like Zn-dependent dehydrogenase